MRKIWKCVAVLALMLMQVQGIFAISPTAAVTAQDEQVILDNELARVGVTAEAKDDVIEWTLDYAKHAPSDASTRAIRFKLASAADGTGTVQRKDGDIQQKAANDGWFREDPAATRDQGKLIVTTDQSVKELHVWVQLDSELMGVQEVDLLQGADAEDHVVTAPEIPVEEQPAADVVETDTTVNVQKPELVEGADQVATTEKQTEKQEEPEVAVEEGHTQIAQLLTRGAANVAHARVGNSNPEDVFSYQKYDDGEYPVHHTDQYIGGRGTESQDNVRNYNYTTDEKTDIRPNVSSILNSGDAFANGYHHYGNEKDAAEQYNVYTKKSVRPGDTENEFKVQLDMIGDAIRPLSAVDVVLVLDKSGSMNEKTGEGISRWEQLQEAVAGFSRGVLGNGQSVQLGMTTFSSQDPDSDNDNMDHEPYAEIASFDELTSTSQQRFRGFTNSVAEITSHSAYTTEPVVSGTPTFIGIDAGLNLLYNANLGARSNATKILITVTDGMPTFAPTRTYTGTNNSNGVANSLGRATPSIEGKGSLLRYKLHNTSTRTLYTGNGGSHLVNENTSFVSGRYGINTYNSLNAYAIGLHVNSNESETARTVLAALGPKGQFDATETDNLVSILNNIVHNAISQIVDAFLTDPMSEFVDYVDGTLEKFALNYNNKQKSLRVITESDGLPQYAQRAVVTPPSSSNENKLTVDHLNLSGDEDHQDGFRLEYTVKLKEEYRDGQFYPTNGTTTLKNNATGVGEDYLHFAIPSVRDTSTNGSLEVEKNWQDSDNKFGLRTDLKFQLQRSTGGAFVDEGEPKDLENGASTVKWTNLPTKLGGKSVTYKVVETTAKGETVVPGYGNPSYSPEEVTLADGATGKITVTNKLQVLDYQFTKTDKDGNGRIGAEFKLTRNGTDFATGISSDANGHVNLTGMPIGKYVLTETKAPEGFQLDTKPFEFNVVVDENGELKMDAKLKNDQWVNERPPYEIILKKTNMDGVPLEGATFELFHNDKKVDGDFVTGSNGEVIFKNDLEPGIYTFRETKAPADYLKPTGIFTLVVHEDGSINPLGYDGEDLEGSSEGSLGDYYATISEPDPDDNGKRTVNITIKNIKQADGQMPMTGGMGTGIIILVGVLLLALALVLRMIAQRKNRGGASDD